MKSPSHFHLRKLKSYGMLLYSLPYLYHVWFCYFGDYGPCYGCWTARLSKPVLALKNARVVYPCLQYFLFFVLSQNREFLQIPLGRDASSLTPQGYAPAYRSRCVFYRFQLVMPDKPEMDEKTMRLVLQNYITGELMNYGISGLSSCYLDPKIGRIPSVFIDRVFFDEAAHYLTLDVLYVCTAEAAEYVKKAIHMDSASKQPDRTVYDDEAR